MAPGSSPGRVHRQTAQPDGCVLQCHAIRSAPAVRSEQPTFMRTSELSAATPSSRLPPGPPQPPSEVSDGLFQLGRRLAGAHPLLTDSVLAAALLLLSNGGWPAPGSPAPRVPFSRSPL